MKKMQACILFLFYFIFTSLGFAQNELPTLHIGISYFYPPFIYNYSSGFDIALANALCQKIGYHCFFYPEPDTELLPNLENGKLDAVMGAVSITEKRLEHLTFTKPYLVSTVSYMGSTPMHYPVDLKKMKLGVLGDSTFATYLENTLSTSNQLKFYPETHALIAALGDGDINLTLLDTPVANYWVNRSDGRLTLVGQPFLLPADRGFGIALGRGTAFLASQLNEALSILVLNGTYQQLLQTYFTFDTHQTSAVKQNEALSVRPPPWIVSILNQNRQ